MSRDKRAIVTQTPSPSLCDKQITMAMATHTPLSFLLLLICSNFLIVRAFSSQKNSLRLRNVDNLRVSSPFFVSKSVISYRLETVRLSAAANDDAKTSDDGKTTEKEKSILLPASSSLIEPSEEPNKDETNNDKPTEKEDEENNTATTVAATSATANFMTTRETKRILIEELGYTRRDTEILKPQFASAIVSKRIRRPETNELPSEWIDEYLATSGAGGGTSDAMLKKLQKESKYPLKTPLLLASTILVGKGLSDLIITLIKVNMGYVGVSLADEFMGVPIVGIDIVCVAVGIGLGVWTWKNMRD